MQWYKEFSSREKKTFWSCFAGWALDGVDTQMFSLVIPALLATWAVSKGEIGLIASLTIAAGAIGGLLAGVISDRYGRVRTLQIAVIWFSLFTFLSAFAQNFDQLLILKSLQGIGFGGEWTAGAVLLSETISARHRGKAMGLVQSAWGLGWGGAVVLYMVVFSWLPPEWAWRVLFMIGAVPAVLVLYLRRNLTEPTRSVTQPGDKPVGVTLGIFDRSVLRMTIVGGLIGVGAHGGYHAISIWLPTYLITERHMSTLGAGASLAIVILAFIVGCFVSAYLQDRIGRRKNMMFFAAGCILTVNMYVFLPMSNTEMLMLSFPLGLFSAGIPATLGALFSEMYPQNVRGRGVGFCYNFGRIVSAGFPFAVGRMSSSMPLGTALGIAAGIAYGLVIVIVYFLPETKGRSLIEKSSGHPAAHSSSVENGIAPAIHSVGVGVGVGVGASDKDSDLAQAVKFSN